MKDADTSLQSPALIADLSLVLYHGVLAARSRWRARVVAYRREAEPAQDGGPGFDSEATTLSWVAQLIAELNRYAARKPAASLQALVMFDEADLYLPAVRQPATKAPMESLLKRARSAGLGVMLATQSPGDLDYRCRENVLTWLIGRVKEPTALEKLKPLAAAVGVDPHAAFPKQKVGQFYAISESAAKAFQADRSWLATEQLSESEILALAKRTLG